MEYRIGKCSACGAEYKIPASFAHDVARCKVCKGAVHIAPTPGAKPLAQPKPVERQPSAASPAKASPPPAPPRDPVVRPQPRPAAPRPPEPAPRAERPAPAASSAPGPEELPAKKKGGSTLERLKAERARERASQQQAKAAKAGGARPRPAAPRAAAAAPARPAAAMRAPASSGGGARAGASARRGARRESPERKRSSAPAILGILAIVALAAGAWFFKDRLFGGEAGTDVVAKENGAPAPLDEPTTTGEAGAAPEAPSGAETPGERPPATDDAAAPSATEPAAEQAPAEGEPDPFAAADTLAKQGPDPDAIDLLALPEFEPARGTSEAEWDQMQEWLGVWMDPNTGAAGNRAKAGMIGMSYKAIPVILNRMKRMDLATDAGQENGNQCQAALREICGGLNFNWKDGTAPEDVVFNKKVVQGWAGLWEKASTDARYLIKSLKLEPDSPEAEAIHAAYGETAEEPTGEEPAAQDDSLDDFEVD